MTSKSFKHFLEAEDATGLAQRLSSAMMALPSGTLPLDAACSQGGRVDDRDIAATILRMERTTDRILARVGVFFTEIVGGCNCNEDPIEIIAYCLLEVCIDCATGDALFNVATT